MAILKIARMGHPLLSGVADPVDDPTAPAVHRLIADMVDTMFDAPGIGLAAPQVHVPLRVVVFRIPPERDSGDDGVPLTALINPLVEPLSDDMEEEVEGCLSVPGMAGQVPRYTEIRYSGLDPQGKVIERMAEGYHARVVQHECDHLDGILYPMRMTDLSTFGYVEELNRSDDGPQDKASDETDEETANG